MFYTCPNGVRVPTRVVVTALVGRVHLEYYQDRVKVVKRHPTLSPLPSQVAIYHLTACPALNLDLVGGFQGGCRKAKFILRAVQRHPPNYPMGAKTVGVWDPAFKVAPPVPVGSRGVQPPPPPPIVLVLRLPLCTCSHGAAWQHDPATLGGGGGRVGANPGQPSNSPTSKQIASGQNEVYSRGQKFEANFGYTNFFLASDLPTDLVVRCPPH